MRLSIWNYKPHTFAMLMLWVKVFHVFFAFAWMAAIFYLPRLFVYHADTPDEAGRERFSLMERKLLGMMNFAGSFSLLFALWLWLGYGFGGTWLWLKLIGVVFMMGYHVWCWREIDKLKAGAATRSSKAYRIINEIPVFALLWILVMVIIKPF